MTTIGIVGMGVVGQAIHDGLLEHGHTVMVNDVDKTRSKFTKRELVEECEIIFICVQTPTIDLGCDLRYVYDAFNQLHMQIAQVASSMPVIAIKSTTLPGTVDTLHAMYPFVCSNPEFMRQDSAGDDFLNPDRIIVGAHSDRVNKKMEELYSSFNSTEGVFYVTPIEAELTKYLSNAYLVTKVAFSQEAVAIGKLLNVDAGKPMTLLSMDHRVHPSHLEPSMGKIPLESACLPKDLEAFLVHLDKANHDTGFLDSVYRLGVDVDSPKRDKIKELLYHTAITTEKEADEMASKILETIK